MNFTKNATITDVHTYNCKVWIELDCGKPFKVHHEFDVRILSEYSKVDFILRITKSKNIKELIGKSVRVVDTGEVRNSLIAIGSYIKNKFIDLDGSEYTLSEKRIYKKHKLYSS